MSAPNYPQPRKIEIPFKVLVQRADPEFEQKRRRETFYEFTGRVFTGDNMSSGAYAPDNS